MNVCVCVWTHGETCEMAVTKMVLVAVLSFLSLNLVVSLDVYFSLSFFFLNKECMVFI